MTAPCMLHTTGFCFCFHCIQGKGEVVKRKQSGGNSTVQLPDFSGSIHNAERSFPLSPLPLALSPLGCLHCSNAPAVLPLATCTFRLRSTGLVSAFLTEARILFVEVQSLLFCLGFRKVLFTF